MPEAHLYQVPVKKRERALDLRSLARAHTPMCIKQLAGIAQHSQNDGARVQAISILLDRGWGKPEQTHSAIDGDIRITIRQIVDGPNVKTIEHDE
jgi:hypothetical protein